jgi:hypothetical protein
MTNILYTIPNSSMYVQILKIRYRGPEYIKVNIAYYTKPGKQKLHTEKNVKLDRKVFNFWEKVIE